MIPAWAANRQIVGSLYTDRYALPAIVGASLLLAGVMEWLIKKNTQKLFSIALVVGLAVGAHIRVGDDFRRDWDFEKDFFWQLYWRAPTIKPDTALLSEGGIFQYTTKYSLSTAINVLYPVPDKTTNLPYWAFELDDLINPDINPDIYTKGELNQSIRNLQFSSPTRNSLIISYQRDKTHCLWVLTIADAGNPDLQHYTSSNLGLSNPQQILSTPLDSTYPGPAIFGPEPAHTWCYFFQKADLARQFGDWEEVTSLGDQVIELELVPGNSVEWIPFIEGYIHQQNMEKAGYLTAASFGIEPKLQASLCSAWTRALQTTPLSTGEQTIVNSILTDTGCIAP